MRKGHVLIALGVLGACAIGAAGCGHLVDDYYTPLTDPKLLDGGTSTDGGGGSIPAGCDPAQNKDAVADTCGAFVSPTGNDDTGKGTKEKPFKSFKKALEKDDTVYACVGQTAFSEEVVLDKKATLFGGLDCASWAYDETKRTALTAEPDKIPLKLASTASGSAVYNFAITAKDAMVTGGSSIAVLADGAEVSFTRSDIAAGNGKDGDSGTTPTVDVGPADPEDPAIKGNSGKTACADPAEHTGGAAKENAVCPAASGGPLGGKGGAADTFSGSNGDVSPATPETALGGQGQPTSDPGTWSCVAGAGLGASGINGATGDPGAGAKQTEAGTISASGYAGVAGKPGGPGKPGQGGGGGGGAKGKTMCAGASGGGGGAGGCGGGGGTGGKAGGASIGIVSLGATLSFDTVTIHVGIGGNGGNGGGGQAGGTGGKGGTGGNGSANGLSNACSGGDGGQGGFGGKGGGGRGGHAIGIAYMGELAPLTTGVSFKDKGTPGDGGIGDSANMGDGAKGVLADVQKF